MRLIKTIFLGHCGVLNSLMAAIRKFSTSQCEIPNLSLSIKWGEDPRVVVSTAAFQARIRGLFHSPV